ncbi:hypothetical protein [Tardiphaga sp.]|uniref:hypothetical protein n=1 Tax=Tardiphaga sp. TaxID=1926292 RepID=UPI0026019B36|nr:hypothetical protein [Tardiphaga sp.]MDB5618394.1 hypothetical protein [Tardiphaga sp.]
MTTAERMKLADRLDGHAIRYAADYGYNVATDLKAASAALRTSEAADAGERWRHKARGSIYEIVSREYVEIWSSESDLGDRGFAWCCKTGERAKVQGRIASGELSIFYRAEDDGTLWARSAAEFGDGRFERVALPEADAGAVAHPLKGDDILREFVAEFGSGQQGTEIDCDTVQSLCDAIAARLAY